MAAVLFLAGLNSKLKLMLADACDGRRLIVILCLIQLRLASGLGYLSCDRWRNLNGYICLKCCWNNFAPPPLFFFLLHIVHLKNANSIFSPFFCVFVLQVMIFFFLQVQQSTTQSAFLHVLYFYYIFLFFPPACNLRHCHTILYHIK